MNNINYYTISMKACMAEASWTVECLTDNQIKAKTFLSGDSMKINFYFFIKQNK